MFKFFLDSKFLKQLSQEMTAIINYLFKEKIYREKKNN